MFGESIGKSRKKQEGEKIKHFSFEKCFKERTTFFVSYF
jgi:hypothetical protein